MPKASIFISHSSVDGAFASEIVKGLRRSDLAPWIDKERISIGTSILEEIGKGLAMMDLFVLVVSEAATKSGWVQKEAEYAAYREVTEKKTLILPFIIDHTQTADLPWHIKTKHVESISPDETGVRLVIDTVRRSLVLRAPAKDQSAMRKFRPNAKVEALLKGRKLGDWDGAEESAIAVLACTDPSGHNELFRDLLTYKDAPDQEVIINALAVAEMCVALAPWIADRSAISELARHPDFTVRSSAASMCMEMASVEPGRVPIDLLLALSRFDEDWYVQAPANAALKAIAHAAPGVLRIFMMRLKSEDHEEREHAAIQLFDISKEEPEIMNRDVLAAALTDLKRRKDIDATHFVAMALANVKKTTRKPKYRYGL